MPSDIDTAKSKFTAALNKAKFPSDIQNLHVEYLGRQGKINDLLKNIKTVTVEQRKEYGQKVNKLKQEIEEQLNAEKIKMLQEIENKSSIDVTLPGVSYPKGSLHVTTLAIEEISKIYERIGFIRVSYPEVEWEYFAFDALNMKPDHPARDDFETFFIESNPHKEYGKMLLTPHTSSGQNREMKRVKQPPIRTINIAKTYRPNWDVTHTPMFHQFEGICIDEEINISHLKGTIGYFAKEFFGTEREIRLRPFHFQFTEPSFEVDVTCGVCLGKGIIDGERCKVCKSGWLELGGAGMMHPNVLKEGGIDPKKYSGWAFGFGVERLFMMKEDFKLDDIRVLYSGDIKFLGQF